MDRVIAIRSGAADPLGERKTGWSPATRTPAFSVPVAENPTGVMVERAFRQIGLRWRYRPMDIPPAGLPAAMAGTRAMSLRGFH
jgi:shikimate 5-dehydrogenase